MISTSIANSLKNHLANELVPYLVLQLPSKERAQALAPRKGWRPLGAVKKNGSGGRALDEPLPDVFRFRW